MQGLKALHAWDSCSSNRDLDPSPNMAGLDTPTSHHMFSLVKVLWLIRYCARTYPHVG